MQLHLGRKSWARAKAVPLLQLLQLEMPLRSSGVPVTQLMAEGELDPCVGGEDKAWNMDYRSAVGVGFWLLPTLLDLCFS